MATDSDTDRTWLRNTRQIWKVDLDGWVGVYGYFATLISAFVLAPVAGLLWTPAIYIAGTLLLLYLAGQFAVYFVLYWCVRCPSCRFNPTRRKSDGRPMSPRILHPRLDGYATCPACNDSGATVA